MAYLAYCGAELIMPKSAAAMHRLRKTWLMMVYLAYCSAELIMPKSAAAIHRFRKTQQ